LAGTHRYLLAAALPPEQLPVPPAVPEQAVTSMIEPLSEREREVLRHISGMLSTTEVATELHISIHTVKTHMRNIHRKLAVAHRGEAVRRARGLGLI
jgi:LuxR family maltose regulon positive regulatory protein